MRNQGFFRLLRPVRAKVFALARTAVILSGQLIGAAQNYAHEWMWPYNQQRRSMALGDMTPKQKSALVIHSTSD